jgi:hemerythrin-like domain-containing protein
MEKKELLIEFLREEHRKIERVLCILEQELSVFNRNGRPDYTKIRAVISYFQEYPDCCHHPKEEMVFEKLKARDPAAAATVGDLEAEHQGVAERLQRVADVVKSVLTSHEVPRKTFNDTMHDFIDHERKHTETEERGLFRVAVTTLRPEDWVLSPRNGKVNAALAGGRIGAIWQLVEPSAINSHHSPAPSSRISVGPNDGAFAGMPAL